MAQSYQTTDGLLVIPGAYPKFAVRNQAGSLSATGIIALVGEASQGPAWSEETDLEANVSYGPDDYSSVIAKYGSGSLVDGFAAAAQASNDQNIIGGPSRIVLIKTNVGVRASLALGSYSTLYAKNIGTPGNQLYATVTAEQAEVVPSVTFSYIPNVDDVDVEFRSNGGSAVALAIPADPGTGATTLPDAFVTAVAALTGIGATGGAPVTLFGGGSVTIAVSGISGYQMNFTTSGTFANAPAVGGTLVIPAGSTVDGGAGQNVGAYVITAVTSNTITAIKKSDAGRTGAVAGTITALNADSSVAVATSADAIAYGPVTISQDAAAVIDGIGKSLEIAQIAGADLFERQAFVLGSGTAVTWISKSGTPALITGTELQAKLRVQRDSDDVDEEIVAGGDVVLNLSYEGTDATVTITSTALSTAVTGGSGGNLSITLADYADLNGLANFINAQTGYSCSISSAVLGTLPPTDLDRVSAKGICSKWGAENGRIKVDAQKLFEAVRDNSAAVQLGNPAARVAAGLPAAQAAAYLANGAKGATSAVQASAAIDALDAVTCNFVVPLFSRDATLDIADGLTDPASNYTIDAIHAKARSHAIAMSKLKKKRNRQALVSYKGAFNDARNKAANLAQFRVLCTFQDIKALSSAGTIVQFQPWYAACVAAGMQAAGFYRAIVRKFANISSAVQAAGDFSDLNDTQVENALLSGLCPLRRHANGGWYWVSDQTTYVKNNNFVYNSLQAVYAADIVALSTAQQMEDNFAGQSLSDITASGALVFLGSIMDGFRRLKLIAPSDDAPAGFKNAKIRISGPVMQVEAEIKLSTALMFIPITFLVSQVEQTA
jgi:hypothetical protein